MRLRLALAVVSCAACTLITPLDSLTGGGMDASTDVVAPDSSMPDAPMDSGTDAIADATPAPFCIGKDAQFCEDFDDSDAAVFPKWSNVSQLRGGTVMRAPSTQSLPFCVACSMPAWDASSPAAHLQRNFLTTPSAFLRYAFSLRVDQLPSQNGFNCATVRLSPVSDAHLSIAVAQAVVEETVPTDAGNVYPAHPLTQNFQVGKWARVVMDFTYGTPVKLEVRVDGMLVLQTNLDMRQQISGLQIGAGITYEGPLAKGSAVSVDDILVEFQ